MSRFPAMALLALIAAGAGPAPASKVFVVCAPGFPGDTVQAQPTMDAFARFAEKSAGLKQGSLTAVYYETENGGVSRLRQDDAFLAMVTLPFFVKHRAELGLKPRLAAVGESGSATETWSLVAKRGAIHGPASLAGWEVTGLPGFAPSFVRGPMLGAWGALPDTTRITFTARVTSALAKAAAGQALAVILDGEQTQALPERPDAADLEVVATSKPLPSSLLCTIGARGGKDVEGLWKALSRLGDRPGGAEILESLRLSGFEALAPGSIEAVLGDPEHLADK